MKRSLSLAIVMLAVTMSPASAQVVISINAGALAHACYIAAKTRANIPEGVNNCTAALTELGLTTKTRAAILNNRGILFDAMKRYDDAWSDFSSSSSHDPTLGDPRLNLGVALIRMEKSAQAMQHIQEALVLGVSAPELAYFDRAVAEEKLGLIADAYYDYKRSLALDPNFTMASNALQNFRVVSKPAASGDSAQLPQ
jgi:tetratricopeptide (TPR) repeat protein